MNVSPKTKDFFQSVYQVVRLIPEGRVTSYGAIAKALGAERSSRMVGWAMHAAHNLADVPAHRVVNRKGLLTGKIHFEEPNEMQNRLEAEGIEIKEDQVIRFKELFWDPIIEIEL